MQVDLSCINDNALSSSRAHLLHPMLSPFGWTWTRVDLWFGFFFIAVMTPLKCCFFVICLLSICHYGPLLGWCYSCFSTFYCCGDHAPGVFVLPVLLIYWYPFITANDLLCWYFCNMFAFHLPLWTWLKLFPLQILLLSKCLTTWKWDPLWSSTPTHTSRVSTCTRQLMSPVRWARSLQHHARPNTPSELRGVCHAWAVCL